jgi:Fe2+ transport system protein FeoA
MTADTLKKGETARITGLADHPVAAKLAEMGCLPGAIIEKLFAAPLGDPAAYQIAGSFIIGLRREEAALVEVDNSRPG